MNEPISIALEQAIRRLEFSGYAYRAPDWFEHKSSPVPPAPRSISAKPVGEMLEAVSAAFGISIHEIVSPRKPTPTVRARFAVYRLLKERLAYGSVRIAKATRRKDHTTVLHGLKRAKELLATDPAWAAAYRAAEHALDQQK